MLGRLTDVEQFEDIIVKTGEGGRITRLRDVARVELGAKVYDITSRLNGAPSASIAVYQLPGSNALEVSKQVRAAMEEMSEFFPEGLEYSVPYDTTMFVNASIKQVYITLVEAALAGISGAVPVPAGLARHPDSGGHHPGVADRHLGGHAGDGVFAEYAHPVRPGAGDRYRGGRRHRGGRGDRGPHGAAGWIERPPPSRR